MLPTIFLFCAVIGGTVMLCQFAMTLLGMGDDGGDFDGGDFDGGDVGDVTDGDIGDTGDDVGDVHHDTSWLFGVLSLRTLVAALAFFGLGGKAALSSGISQPLSLVIALGCGVAAMYGVYALLRAIYSLQADGTRRIENAQGARGSVLVPIPPGQTGVGKIHVSLQGRLVELPAITEHGTRLGTGMRIEVVEVLGPNTVRVEPIVEAVETAVVSHETAPSSDPVAGA